MCGIFGGVVGHGSPLREARHLEQSMESLFRLSESRGKEAAGLAVTTDAALTVYKAARPAREMIRDRSYRAFVRDTLSDRTNGVAFIGHSRLVTDGGREINKNNQPVMGNGVVGIHNGIIVNHSAIWERHTHLRRESEVDSEVIFALIRDRITAGADLMTATRGTFAELQGVASIAAMFDDRDQLLLATNNGSLYYRHAPATSTFVFASESYILDQFAEEHGDAVGTATTEHLRAGEAVIVDLSKLTVHRFALDGDAPATSPDGVRSTRRPVIDRAPADPPMPAASAPRTDFSGLAARFPYRSLTTALRRCTRCILPETMPYVDFDADGVCSYCRHHKPLEVRGLEALQALVAPHRRTDGRPDCLVAVSGGRDSMYGLHFIKTVLGMNPVAYTYDWGMVTDLARRNTSRICGKLGIEHILVSADIPRKRENIRKNVEAWLAQPALGTVPLFMAGDKAYFHYLQKAREQLGLQLAFLCENPLERTDFKTGFAGVTPTILDEDHVFTLPVRKKVDLALYYGREFLTNRKYLNTSLLDTAMAFGHYYLSKHDDYHNLYWFTEWNEERIDRTLIGEYGFELAPDAKTTWRIGDGTAAFYNYIYYAMAGLTENDTFRSNQIRAGVIPRDRALALADRDNHPRFPSIEAYLRLIGMRRSIDEVIAMIERAPKLPPLGRL